MTRFTEALRSPEQVTGELYSRAHKALLGSLSHERIVNTEDSQLLATSSITPITYHERHRITVDGVVTNNLRDELSEHYALAVPATRKILKRGYRGQIYLIANDNFTNPVFAFYPAAHSLINLTTSEQLQEEDIELTKDILTAFEKHNKHERKNRIDTVGSFAKFVGGLAIVGLVAYGAINKIASMWDNHQETHQENIRRDQEAWAAFDEAGIIINGTVVDTARQIEFVASDPSFFDQDVPSSDGANETYEHARLIFLDGDSCTEVTNINPEEEAARIVTTAQPEEVVISVDSRGVVKLCNSDTQTRVALQITDTDRN